MQVNKLFEPIHQHKRAKLNLPAPVISENDLQEIVKMGSQPELYKEGNHLTDSLIGTYKTPTPMRTVGRTPLRSDLLMEEARNIAKIRNLPTPLLGGQQVELEGGLKYNGLTPMPPPKATPGPRSVFKTPQSTPFRDEFGLNDNSSSELWDKLNKSSEGSNFKETLKKGLANLPEPQNAYETEIPELPKIDEEGEIEEDAEETERKRQEEEEKQKELEFLRRSQVLQRDMPRPCSVNPNFVLRCEDNNYESNLVLQEISNMVLYDSLKYPLKITKKNSSVANPEREEFSDEQMKEARDLFDSEILIVKEENEKNNGKMSVEEYEKKWNEINDNLLYDPVKKTYVNKSTLSNEEIINCYKYEYEILKVYY